MGRATIKRQQQQQLEKVSATETVFMGGSGWRRRMINARFGVRRIIDGDDSDGENIVDEDKDEN